MWFLTYLVIFVSGLALTALLVRKMIVLAVLRGMIDYPAEHKFHQKPTPLLGGVGIFLGFWITVLTGVAVIGFAGLYIPSLIRQYADGVWLRLPWLGVVLVGGLAMGICGLYDDKYNLNAPAKLGIQLIVAVITVAAGIRARLFLPEPLSYLISITWILVITNSFNLLDNMDGVSAGCAFIAGFFLFLIACIMQNYFVASFLACFMGCLIGFLIFNFPPASIFMGDCGSMFIGYIMSVVTIVGTYYGPGSSTVFSVVIPLVVLAVPIFDTVSVMVIRLTNKKPVFTADKNHFSHRLAAMGMDVKTAVLFLYLVTFCLGLSSLLVPLLPVLGVIVVLFQTAGIIGIIAVLEYYNRKPSL